MANTYTWFIDGIDVIPFFGGQSNVVKNVRWHVMARSNDPTPKQATQFGTTPLNVDNLTDFVPYSAITKTTLIEWLTVGDDAPVDTVQIYAMLDAKIAAMQQAAPSVPIALPFKG